MKTIIHHVALRAFFGSSIFASLLTWNLLENASAPAQGSESSTSAQPALIQANPVVHHRTETVNGLEIFYREAGPADAPVVLLMHGFPSSSSMFRDLIPVLATKYHVIAPDYPGFGRSSMPPRDQFKYTFDNLASVMDQFVKQKNLTRFALYVQDYGAPVGYRLFESDPTRVSALIVQNGNAYDEGIDNDFWKPLKAYWADPSEANREALRPFTKLDATRWQYVHGSPNPTRISPDAYIIDQYYLDRPGNADIQLDLFLSYGSNPAHYPTWQKLFRQHQPPALVVWGKNDVIFPSAGAEPYKRDLKDLEFHLLDAGHFALEEQIEIIGPKIFSFLDRKLKPKQ